MYPDTPGGYQPITTAAPAGTTEEIMDRVTMTIEGMSCGHCVMAVRKALQAIDGVEVEEVKVGSATVAFDPAATSAEKLTEAVQDEGYEVVSAA